jgi:hypothetical protein
MKKNYSIALMFLTLVMVVLMGCDKHSDETQAEINTKKLMGDVAAGDVVAWDISSVLVDNVDQSGLFVGMKLTFNATDFGCLKGQPVWPLTGKWSFTNDEGLIIKRDDGIEVTIVELTDRDASTGFRKLILSLDWNSTTFSSGRATSVKGHHVFTLYR